MLTTAALRHDHVRTVPTPSGSRRACPCCASLPNGRATAKLRRTQRRREARQWRTDEGIAR